MSFLRIDRPWLASAVLLVSGAPLGCFKADEDAGDEVGDTGTDGDGDGTESSDSNDTSSTDDATTDTDADATDTETDADTSDTETGTPGACGDGTVDPGELCLSNEATETALPGTALRMDTGRFGLYPGVAVVGGASAPASVMIVPGNGDLTFGAVTQVPIDAAAISIVVADLDDDGDHDFATHGGLICSRLNTGGVWGSGDSFDDNGLGTETTRIQAGQFDANAALDLVWGDGYNTNWVRGNSFQGWTFGTSGSDQYTGGDSWVEITELGFDGDAFTDLVVTSQWEAKVSVVRGAGNATFTEQGQVTVCEVGTCEIRELHVDDIDGDENPDIIASFDAGITISTGDDIGTFNPPVPFAVPGADYTTSDDIDNDGDVDVLVASATTGDLYLLLNDGAGGLAEPIVFATPSGVLRTAAIVDLDEDGAKELVTVYNYDGSGWIAVFAATP